MKKIKLFFALFAMLALGVENAWAETFKETYTYSEKGNTWNLTECTDKSSYWLVPSGSNPSVASVDGLFAGKTITSDVKITINHATFGSGSNPSASTFTIYNSISCSSVVESAKSGTLASSSTYADVVYTIAKNTAVASLTDDIAIKITKPGKQIRLKSIIVEFEYTTGGSGGETPEPDPDPTPDLEPEPGTGGEETWTLVTNASDLKAGDEVVIAAAGSDYALGKTQNTNNRDAVGVTKGTNTITIGDDVQIITLETGNVANTFAFNTGSAGYLYAASSTANNLRTQTTLDNNGSWAISITSAGVATIQAKGTNTRNLLKKNSSSALFSCYGSGQSDVAIYKKVTSTDEPSTPTPSVSVAPTSHTFATTNVGETATQEFTITAENTTATLSASIDNTTDFAISAIADNKITVTYQPQTAETHEATLTIKAGEEASTTVALTGKAVAALEGTWILVTDASSLKAGDEIIIAAKEYDVALSTTQNNNNRGEVAITKNQNTITATSEAQVLTLQAGKTEGTLALYTGAGYLHAASSTANHLKTETELSNNSSWTIAVEADGTATLTAQGTYTRNTLCYNKSNKLFACYASTNLQQPIVIYKNTNGQQLAGLAYETTKYLTKLGETFATPVLVNPNSVDVTYESSDNNVATVAADGAVTIEAAGVVTITASFAGNSSFLEGSASYTIGVTEHAGTEADPYSVADARRVIDVMETAEGVYATGIVSEIVTAYNATYGNITYNISIDGSKDKKNLRNIGYYHGYKGYRYIKNPKNRITLISFD